MDSEKGTDAETSRKLIVSCEKYDMIEDINKIERQEVAAVIESELQSKDICMKINYVKDGPSDQHTGLENENHDEIKSSVYKYEESLHFSSLKETRYQKHETVFTTNPVITLNRVKSGRVDKSERLKTMSLRQSVLIKMTYLKYFSEEDGGFTSCDDLPPEFKAFEVKRSKMPDEENDETRNYSIEDVDENSFFPNEFHFRSDSTNISQEAATNEIQHSVSAQSIYSTSDFISPKIFSIYARDSQTQEIRSGDDVWHHFKGFLHANRESLDRIMSDGTGTENMETSDYINHRKKDAKMTEQETVNQNLAEPSNTKLEDKTTEIQYDLGSGITLIMRCEPKSAVVLIREIRSGLLKLIRFQEKMLKNKQNEGLQEQDMLKQMKCLAAAQNMRKLLQCYFDIMCDDQKLVVLLDRNKLYSRFCNLSNLRSLMELPLPETDILSFYTLFLYLRNSLHTEVATEDVFKRIDFKHCVVAYRTYCELKERIKSKREKTENDVFGRIFGFSVSLEEYRLKTTQEISHFETGSLEDYKNYINVLRIAIYDNLTCWYKLISNASSLVDPINSYMSVLRKSSLLQFSFMDQKCPDVFS